MRAATSTRPAVITGQHPQTGTVFAAFDPAARYVTGVVEGSRLGAILKPYRSEAEAVAALRAAGAVLE